MHRTSTRRNELTVHVLRLCVKLNCDLWLCAQHVLRWFRASGVAADRARRAVAELRRKSFHLVGLLIPFIYYLVSMHSCQF
jgi:hypothetical protein